MRLLASVIVERRRSPIKYQLMKASTDRILVTHTGSLPRPDALRRLYVRQSRNEAIPDDELKAAARKAVVESIRCQVAAGVDIGNDGEQQRGAFFLDIRHRMKGFGGSWKRPARGDVLKYPSFQRVIEAQSGKREAVTAPNVSPPEAVGEISYVEPGIGRNARCFAKHLKRRAARSPRLS